MGQSRSLKRRRAKALGLRARQRDRPEVPTSVTRACRVPVCSPAATNPIRSRETAGMLARLWRNVGAPNVGHALMFHWFGWLPTLASEQATIVRPHPMQTAPQSCMRAFWLACVLANGSRITRICSPQPTTSNLTAHTAKFCGPVDITLCAGSFHRPPGVALGPDPLATWGSRPLRSRNMAPSNFRGKREVESMFVAWRKRRVHRSRKFSKPQNRRLGHGCLSAGCQCTGFRW